MLQCWPNTPWLRHSLSCLYQFQSQSQAPLVQTPSQRFPRISWARDTNRSVTSNMEKLWWRNRCCCAKRLQRNVMMIWSSLWQGTVSVSLKRQTRNRDYERHSSLNGLFSSSGSSKFTIRICIDIMFAFRYRKRCIIFVVSEGRWGWMTW